MAVVGVAVEMADSPTGMWGWSGQTFERTFKVVVDDFDDGPVVVMSAPGLPQIKDLYQISEDEQHEFAVCKRIRPKRAGPGHLTWIVTCTYDTLESSSHAMSLDQELDAHDDPLLEIPDVSIKPEIFQLPVWGAINPSVNEVDDTLAITNSAREIISPPFQREHTRLVLKISRNEDADDYEAIFARSLQYQNTINGDEFWGALPHHAKIHPFEIQRISRSIGATGELKVYLRVTYTIHFQWPDWDLRPLDNGANYIGADGKLKSFKNRQGHPYRGLLDGSGKPLAGVDADDIPKALPPTTPPVFLGPIQIYPSTIFGDLNLPQSILGDNP